MIGVTGTNGKTTVTCLVKHVLEQTLGAKVGLIGTIENRIGDTVLPTERTTPESFALQGPAAADARCGLHACGDGGLVPCAGAAPRGRHPVHGRCVHEPDGGPPRFP